MDVNLVMDKIDTKFIGINVRALREATGLSQHDFALLVEISIRSVPNIESGEKNIDVEILRKIKNVFFMYSRDQLCNGKIEISDNLNEQLIRHFKKSKPELAALLDRTPKIVYAIKYNLLKGEFLNDFKETNEIRKYFEDQGWSFKGTSITNALTRMDDLIEVKRHSDKKNTNLYRKKEL